MPWGRNHSEDKGRGGPAPTGIPRAVEKAETLSIPILAQQAVDAENSAREVAFRLEVLVALADVLATTGAEIRRHVDGLTEDFRRLDRLVGGR